MTPLSFRLLCLALPLALGAAAPAAAQSGCLPAVDAALARDIEAAVAEGEKQAWSDLEKRHALAEQSWAAAAALCGEPLRDKAARGQADAAGARARAARLAESSAACEQAVGNAERAVGLTRDAWGDKRWEDAARWAGKADLAWESALAQCSGERRAQALAARDAARLDAHNAVHCAPLWARATELTARLKADMARGQGTSGGSGAAGASGVAGTTGTTGTPGLSAAERATRQDQLENAWTEAAFACKGASAERALASAEALSKARGTRPLSVPPRAAAGAASGVASGVAAAGAGAEPAAPSRLRGEGVSYIGQFRPGADGRVSGRGRVEWDNGDVFEGALVDGLAHGSGLFRWKNGDRYEGGFVAGQPDGTGSYRWSGGDRYEGAWRQGKKHGRGRYVWADGRQREGEYVDNEPVGEDIRRL